MKRILGMCFSLLLIAACNSTVMPPCEENCGEPVPPPCEGDECGEPGPGPQPPDPPQPPAGNNKLYVEGRQLMLNGQPKVLRGMSLYWYQGPWTGGQPGNNYYNAGTVQKLADPNDWGSNVVRAAIGCVYEKPDMALTMAKNMMDWAKNNNIYVIIDNHTHYAHRPAAATAANNFFRDVSAHVKNNGYTHVLYEIYNEPICDDDRYLTTPNSVIPCGSPNGPATSWAIIKTYAEGVIRTIRNNDPDGVILVGTPNYSANIHQVDQIAGQKNLMYVLHYYASESAHNSYKTRLKDAYCKNLPIFITEWGTSPASGSGNIDTNNNNDWMSLIQGAKVSWANWSLSQAGSGTRESSGALASGDGTVSGATSQSGTIVKQWIRELNAGRSVSGVNSQTISCP